MITITPTPMMAQWHACKEAAPGTILFFRLGDFYEAFYEDAILISRELDLTLTKRQEIPMAGFPHQQGEIYIDRLVGKGFRVSIAEQMEDPKDAKGIVKREIVRIVTPGTVINSNLLLDKEQNFLASILNLNQRWGLSYIDITTAAFFTAEFETKEALFDELVRISPKELLLSSKWKEGQKDFIQEIRQSFRPSIHFVEGWHFDHQSALNFLCSHFGIHSLDTFGLKGMVVGINAAGALLNYIHEELNLPIAHIKTLSAFHNQTSMQIDKATQRNLELIQPLQEGQKEATLLYWIDDTKTPMGGRLLRSWLLHPLLSPEAIVKRQDEIEIFMKDFQHLLHIRRHLGEIRDLERLMMRIETGYAAPRDLIALKISLEQLPPLSITDPTPICEKINSALVENPPLRLSDGGLFKKGFNKELDELVAIKEDSTAWMAAYQNRIRESSGIKTLKVGYTKAFGYYIEISKSYVDRVPSSFIRRQTLVNCERFITEELKDFEYKILSADEKIGQLESTLFTTLRQEVGTYAAPIRELAKIIAEMDCTSALAKVAIERNYVRPVVDSSSIFDVKGGRHPIIEATLGTAFIPNDIHFEKQLALITGPNMAGKSTYIRQVALIAILAQIGSFVPAESAHIGVIDKVFSRIGASDDLARGQSTFMVEMIETAQILRNATDRSLVILDEIGRGTSTYDGISIAWAVAEYLLTTLGKQAKTLFATHYFELTDLATLYPGVFNLNVAIEETGGGIVFLRKIKKGTADKSYGIHVAKLAGLPLTAIKAAEKKLASLEMAPLKPAKKKTAEFDLFAPQSPLEEELKQIDPHALTPLEALATIARRKNALRS